MLVCIMVQRKIKKEKCYVHFVSLSYKVMLQTWRVDPDERPTFSEMVSKMGDFLEANVTQVGEKVLRAVKLCLCVILESQTFCYIYFTMHFVYMP